MKKKQRESRQAYFIGIKGVGMTMLAQFLKAQGWIVSGSDISDRFLTDAVLARLHIPVFSPFRPDNLPARPDLIIHSSAYSPENNVELQAVSKRPEDWAGAAVLSYAEALGQQFNRYRGVAVCGSHGKTTTTAWLGYVLSRAGLSPNVLVGSNVPQFKGSGLSGQSRYLVAEVDEYQDKMRFFSPFGVLLNNIDYDHPDFFKSKAAYTSVFRRFIRKIPASGWLVVNLDDRLAAQLAGQCSGRVVGYSLQKKQADYYAADWRLAGERVYFTIYYRGRRQGEFCSSLAGLHNIANALAVVAAARQLGVSWTAIRRHLGGFKGTDRRCQILGEYRGATIVDDYAHHPAEIQATLAGLRARWPQDRLIVVFHPHTYSRTQALFNDFVRSFPLADELIILDVYSSARESASAGNIDTSAELAQAVAAFNRAENIQQAVRAITTIEQAAAYLRPRLKPGDRLVLMGAGDVFRLAEKLPRS